MNGEMDEESHQAISTAVNNCLKCYLLMKTSLNRLESLSGRRNAEMFKHCKTDTLLHMRIYFEF